MSEPDETSGARDERAYRRRFRDKGNKRDDWAIDAFREVFAALEDPGRVDRLLFDLGRYYNALTDGPIVSLAVRQHVAGLLANGRRDEARQLLTACLERYRGGIDDQVDIGDPGQPPGPSRSPAR